MADRLVRIGPAVVGWTAVGAPLAGSRRHPDARVAGRHLLRRAVSAVGGIGLRLEQRCLACGGVDHGPPRDGSGDTVVSVAYAVGVVVVAAARITDARAIGVDVEPDVGELPELAALFHPEPAPDAARWTAIEAALKADGRGILVAPESVSLDPDAGIALVPGRARALAIHTVAGPAGHVVSLALDSSEGPTPGAPRPR